MMNNQSFKKKLIATAVASGALAGMGQLAHAQNDDAVIEEVVVTGIRASLERAMDIKRDSSGVVDAISAEDIGKFPDTNLAESLQRITGVSIDRRDGEGSKVTVRGLGPDFNLVTLNGRQMPGASANATSASGSRSFDFANLASEGVQAVEVYKTGRADVPPGGMGATINIVTPQPLETGSKASVGVKGVWDESAPDSEFSPEISGIYSETFADGKFGVAVVASYQERQGGSARSGINSGWMSLEGSAGGWGAVDPENNNIRNMPSDDDVYSVPQGAGYAFTEFERTRTNGQLTLQFAPVEALEATLDYTYSENEIDSKYTDTGAWFNWGGQNAVFTDKESPAAQTPLLYAEQNGGADITNGVGRQNTEFKNDSIGLNVEWKATDSLTLTLDAHSSTAEVGPGNDYGNSVGIATSVYTRDRSGVNLSGDMPVLLIDSTDGAGGNNLRAEDAQVSGSFFRNSQMEHEIDQIQLDGEWEFNDELSVQFGVARTESDYQSAFSNVQRDTWGGLGSAPVDAYFNTTILDNFSDEYGQTSEADADFLELDSAQPWNQRFDADFEAVRQYAAENLDDGAGPADCADGSTWYCKMAPDEFNRIQEDSESAYVQVNYDTEIAKMPFRLMAGLRYESTEVATPSTEQSFGPLEWIAANEFTMPKVGDPQAVTATGEYDNYLPSVDLSLEPVEDVVLRASYSTSIARPGWLDLRGGENYAQLGRIDGVTGSRGTPGLEPFESDNIDLSVEWYYGDASYVSVGYFEKEVSNFIGSRVVDEDGSLDNTPHPGLGERAQAAMDAGAEGNDEIRQYIYDNFADPDTAYLDASGNIVIVGIPNEDPNTPVRVTEVANSDETVDIDGIEVAIQHNFWDTGFGVIANYTAVDESTEYDNLTLNDPQFAITGVSDTANLIAFYEKNGIQARIAYNWRDDFLAATTGPKGNNPRYVSDYSQVDLNVSYDVTDNLSVFLEGLNLTEENGRAYGRGGPRQTYDYYEGYARYNIGARYTF